jgi:adenosine deaminase
MCPYANYQIHRYCLQDKRGQHPQRTHSYPLLDYLNHGLRVTVNTDNIGISAADLTQNLLLAARLCPGLTRLDLLKLQRNALELAFISPTQRNALLQEFQKKLSLPKP